MEAQLQTKNAIKYNAWALVLMACDRDSSKYRVLRIARAEGITITWLLFLLFFLQLIRKVDYTRACHRSSYLMHHYSVYSLVLET